MERQAERAADAIDVGAATHPGRVRSVNEDAHLVHTAAGLYAVADGMGGHEGGRFASTALVERLAAIEPAAEAADLLARLEDAIIAANAAIRARAGAGRTMGTTLAALLLHGDSFAAVWCGDSRVYRLAEGAALLLTHDHTEAQQLVDEGVLAAAEAKGWHRGHVLTRAIGTEPLPDLEIETGRVLPGEAFLLCSDGLLAHLCEEEIATLAGADSAQAACEALLAAVLDRGAEDNVTVIVVRTSGDRPRPSDAAAG